MFIKKFLCLAATAALLMANAVCGAVPAPAPKGELSAYDALFMARQTTHAAGPFRFSGTQTTNNRLTTPKRVSQTHRFYQMSGYNVNAYETFIQFDSWQTNQSTGTPIYGSPSASTSLLLNPEGIYGKTGSGQWIEQDVIRMLSQFTNMGVLDQFFLLEILNSNRLPLYKDFVSYGPDMKVMGVPHRLVYVDFTRAQYAEMVEAWAEDIEEMLGPAAEGMSDFELNLTRTLAKRTLTALDAEAHYVFYVDMETGIITQINSGLDTADPNGTREANATARVLSKSSIKLFDFGKRITQVVV